MSTHLNQQHSTQQLQLRNTMQDIVYIPGPDDCENIEDYVHGGLHPVDIGDHFNDGQYKIIHKLGYGATATVWLARDTLNDKYVGLKILSAEKSLHSTETVVQQYIRDATGVAYSTSIVNILNQFTFGGPNGEHKCIVLELAGPSLRMLGDDRVKFRPVTARKLAKELTQTIKEIHSIGVVAGDLSADNLLLGLTDIHSKSQAEIYDIFGMPELSPVELIEDSGAESDMACDVKSDAVPRFQCPAIKYPLDLIESHILLTDIDEAVLYTNEPHDMQTGEEEGASGVNVPYAAPEWILDIQTRHTKASDIWALGCLFYELRSSNQLFDSPYISPLRVYQLIGDPPLEVRDAVFSGEYEETPCSGKRDNNHTSIACRLADIGKWTKWHYLSREEKRQLIVQDTEDGLTDPSDPDCGYDVEKYIGMNPPHAALSPQELLDLTDLLSKMLRWLPKDRLTIEEVFAHPWLNTDYSDLDPECPEICAYDVGTMIKVLTIEERYALIEKKKIRDEEERQYLALHGDEEEDDIFTDTEDVHGESIGDVGILH